MKKLCLLLLVFSAFTYAKSDAEKKIWRKVGLEVNSIMNQSYQRLPESYYYFDLTSVIFTEAGWTTELVESHFSKTNEIFKQCGIQIRNVKTVSVQAAKKFSLSISTPKDPMFSALVAKVNPQKNLHLFWIKNVNERSMAIAGAEFYMGKNHVALNTILVSAEVESPNYWIIRDMNEAGQVLIYRRDSAYDVLAHELTHILANSPHVEEKNLLAGDALKLNGALTPEQCLRIQSYPLVKRY